ncbi:MAG: hypothetical protein ACE5JQ_11975 [Candidatus Methylomirabilales bacterium]
MDKRMTPRISPSSKRRRLATRKGAVTTSMALPRELHQRAMVAAVRLNWTLAELVRAAIAEWLGRHEKGTSSKGRVSR